MTNEQITQWASEVGIRTMSQMPYTRFANPKQLHEFATLVRNAPLEEAALKCHQMDFSYSMCEQYRDGNVACECADEIRKLKS